MRNSVRKYIRNSGKFYCKKYRRIPCVFKKIPYSVGSQKRTSVDTLLVRSRPAALLTKSRLVSWLTRESPQVGPVAQQHFHGPVVRLKHVVGTVDHCIALVSIQCQLLLSLIPEVMGEHWPPAALILQSVGTGLEVISSNPGSVPKVIISSMLSVQGPCPPSCRHYLRDPHALVMVSSLARITLSYKCITLFTGT